jgi:ornithine cyclodeaminase
MTLSAPKTAHPATRLLVIDGDTVESLLSLDDCLLLAEAALRKTSSGAAHQDVRRILDLAGDPGTCLSAMYASLDDRPLFGAKVQSVFPANFEHGLPSHQGGVLLFDKSHGQPAALIDASAITGSRTPAATAVATRVLSREDSAELAVLGYGEQAARHIATIARVRSLKRVRVWGRDARKAQAFAAAQQALGHPVEPAGTAREAVENADIVCTVTSARLPVLEGAWLSPGTHVNAVGASIPALREIDVACVKRSTIWVDYLPMAMVAASDLFEPLADGTIDRSQLVGEIGEVLNGTAKGRQSASETTLFRSLGVPAQDIEFANFVYQKAKSLGLGAEVSL